MTDNKIETAENLEKPIIKEEKNTIIEEVPVLNERVALNTQKFNGNKKMAGVVAPSRNFLIDNYRGFIILAVIVWCSIFLGMPNGFMWAKHTDAYGKIVEFGVMDYGMIMFLLATAFSIPLAWKKKVESVGKKGAYIHFLKRAFILMGIGAIHLLFKNVGDGTIMNDSVYGWEIFMSIGLASIIGLIFIDKKIWVRVVAGFGIIALYGALYALVPLVSTSTQIGNLTYGGPFGAIGLAGLLLIFTVVGDLYRKKKLYFFLSILVFAVISIPSIVLSAKFTAGTVEVSKFTDLFLISFTHFKPGFLIFGGLFSLLSMLPIMGITKLIKKPIPLVSTMGKNTIVFFFIFAILTIPAGMIWGLVGNNIALGIILNTVLALGVSLPIAYLFEKKKIIVKA